MDIVIDQTWVKTWGQKVTREDRVQMAMWVATRSSQVQELALLFPPHCLVRQKAEDLRNANWDATPTPTTLGVLLAYHQQDPMVRVRQHPTKGDPVWVHIEQLSLALPWGGLTPEYLRGYLEGMTSSATPKPIRGFFEKIRGAAR